MSDSSPTTPSPAASKDERIQKISWWRSLLSRPELGAFAGAVLIFLFFCIAAGDKGFLGARGIMSWLEVSAQLGIIAIGATLLMIGGEFDLSVGSMIAAAGAVFLYPIVWMNWPIGAGIALVFVFALLIGLINGTLVNRTGLPSFIVTLAFLYILRGLTLGVTRLLSGTTQISVRRFVGNRDGVNTLNDAKAALQDNWLGRLFSGDTFQPVFTWLAKNDIIASKPNGDPIVAGIPVSVVWWIGLALLAVWVLRNTKFGNWIFAIGGNADAARNAGVPVQFVRVVLFMVTAVCATIFALLQVMDIGSTDTVRGQLKEFEAIIIAVIGGTLLTGGYGSVVGSIFGALIFGMTSQGIFFAGWNTDWFKAILGALLLAAVLFNNFLRKRAMGAK